MTGIIRDGPKILLELNGLAEDLAFRVSACET